MRQTKEHKVNHTVNRTQTFIEEVFLTKIFTILFFRKAS